MNDAKLISVPLYFQFCLCAEAVMVACFSFFIEGIKEREGFCMQSNQFWFDLKLGR